MTKLMFDLLTKLYKNLFISSINMLILCVLILNISSCKKDKKAETKVFSVLSQSSSDTLMQCHRYDIRWEGGIEGDVCINLLKNGVVQQVITSSTKNDGIFSWYVQKIPALIGNNCFKIQVVSLSDNSVTGQSNANFTIINDNTSYAKRIELISPNGGEVWGSGLPHSIIFEKNFTENVNIYMYIGNSSYGQLNNNPGDTIIVYCANWPTNTNYKIKVASVLDPNVCDFSDDYFELSGGGK